MKNIKKIFKFKKSNRCGTTRYLKSMDDLPTSKDKKLEPYLTFSNEKLPIDDPVNIIFLQNTIHFAEPGTIPSVINNLLDHLLPNGLIIILEPSIDASFGSLDLNISGSKRDAKMKTINTIRNELEVFLKLPNDKIIVPFFRDIEQKDGKKYKYGIVIKKIK